MRPPASGAPAAPPPPRPDFPRGFSLLEVLIAIVVVSVGVLAVSAATAQSVRRSSLSALDVQRWTAVARVADSLTAEGWGGVTGGDEAGQHFSIGWTVTAPEPDLDRVDLIVSGGDAWSFRPDSMTLYLAKP